MTTLPQTPSQTVGPYFAYGLTAVQYGYADLQIATGRMADETLPGNHIRISGRVLDIDGKPVPDAMIELWQADSEGRIAGKADGNSRFTGFGRQGTGTDPDNRFMFETVKPGKLGPGEAPFILVVVFMRGLLSHLYTRLYFDDETPANATDPVLATVPEDRRRTLIATSVGAGEYVFDVHLQGADETVFFDV
jgi:protocatechuate 3,4-dioxygenase alpha subunit